MADKYIVRNAQYRRGGLNKRERRNERKNAEMDAKKNALRAYDIQKGVFVLVSNLPKSEPS